MPKTIGIISIKGGVGKTTIASSLAFELANHFNKKVLLVDANYGAPNLGLHMGIIKPEKTIHDVLANKIRIKNAVHSSFGLDVIPGSYAFNLPFNPLKLRNKLRKIKNNYDFIIIDSSPSLNEELLSVIIASDNLFVVTTPDYPTISCSIRAAKLAKQRGRPISGIILNKIREPKYELSLREIEESTNIPVIAKIRDDKVNAKALFYCVPSSMYNKKSKFAREINNLAAALTNNKERNSLLKRLMSFSFKKEEVNRQIFKEEFYRSWL